MSLEIYPRDFHTRYEISQAISVMLSAYYDKVGKLTVVVPISDYNIQALQNECIVYDTTRDLVFVIQYVKTETDLHRITAYGYTAEWLLDKRSLMDTRYLYQVETEIYAMINDNLRGMQSIRTAKPLGLTEAAEGEAVEPGQLLTKTSSALHNFGLGRRALWDDETKQVVYQIYKGADRTKGLKAVVFSDEQGTARDLVINDDLSNWKNVAYITVEYADDTSEVISVGTAEGDDRREIWSDRRIIQFGDETYDDVISRAKSEAALALARNVRRQNFSVTVDPAELGVMYKLGDIVSCVSVRFGVSFTARVSGIKYTMDTRGRKTEVVLGEPTLTSIGGINL